MRVLMTTDTVGGVWTYTCELAAALLQRGCAVILVSMGKLPQPAQQLWLQRTSEHWPEDFRYLPTDFKLEWMQNSDSCYKDSERFLLQWIHAYQPDIVHSNQFCYGALPVGIPKLVVAHSDVRSWAEACDSAALIPSPWLQAYDAVVKAGVLRADTIVAPTRWMADRLAQFYNPVSRIEVIANGRSLPELGDRPKRKLQAVTCGRLWDKAKNVHILSRLSPPLPIKVAGDCYEPGSSQCAEIPALTNLGRLTESEVLELFCESAIYIVTSRYEPFGLSPIEAALCGCAIVANDIPSLREVWGSNAIYFDRDDASSLEHILHSLSQDQPALEDAAARAHAHVVNLYSTERMTTAYMELYGKLCQRTVPCAS
jgi:glycogen(starch) synthase